MKFIFTPTFEIMDEIYSLPKGMERFDRFIRKLRGNAKDDISFPIAAYNPMAGEELHKLLKRLIKEEVEGYVEELLLDWNNNLSNEDQSLQIAVNLIDDEGGLWSQKYLTEFENRFKNQAMLRRKMIVMNLYRSEEITKDLIKRRLDETIHRNIYQFKKRVPKQAGEHIEQELYVQNQFSDKSKIGFMESDAEFSNKHRDSELYNVIFCYFYGKGVCEELGYGVNL